MADSLEKLGLLLFNPKVQHMARYLASVEDFAFYFTGKFDDGSRCELPLVRQEVVMRVVVSGLIQVWAMVRQLSPDGVIEGGDVSSIDQMCGIPHFGEAMQKVGWLEVKVGWIEFKGFKKVESEKPAKEKSAPKEDAGLLSYPEDFVRFWDAYPKKVSKGDALKAWRKIKPSASTVEKILHAIEVQKKSEAWKKDRGQFIPYPASWLNAIGWENVAEHNQLDDVEARKRAQWAKEKAARKADEEKARTSAVDIKSMIAKMRNQK